jgi:Cd2+/Zn2+-exporting ATPase
MTEPSDSSGRDGLDCGDDRTQTGQTCGCDVGGDEACDVARLDEGSDHVALSVPEMDCPSCASKVEKSVQRLTGVEDVDPQVATGTLTVGYDGEATSAEDVVDAVEGAGYAVESRAGSRTETFDVPDMDCPSCAGKVETALADVEGVSSLETRPATGTVVVTFDDSRASADDLVAAVEGAGYDVTGSSVAGESTATEGGRESVWRSARAKKTALSGVFLALGLLVEYALTEVNGVVIAAGPLEFHAAELLFLAGVAAGGQEILRGGYYSARTFSLDIDFLMSSAILSAVTVSLVATGTSLYFEAATLAFLVSVSELLERYSMDRTRDSLQELLELSPDEATVRRESEEVTVPVEEVRVGDVVVVRPGEKIPMDGEVREGESAVDESPITGESVPVDKTPGDEVYAGTVNEGGYLEVDVTSAAGEDTLSQIIGLVEDAQSNRTEHEQFVERFAGYYTPFMVGVAIVVTVVPPLLLGGDWTRWFVAGITMLVLACPCAFVISTPVSVVSGITSAAKNGVLIKGGTYLEAMGEVEAVALDKTGTLTRGELAVTDVVPLNGNDEDDVLRCARGLEERSEHPIGEAIVAHADGASVEGRDVTQFENVTGKGVRAHLDGVPHYAGKPAFFDELGFDLEHAHVVGDGAELGGEVRQLCDRQGCLNLVEDTIPRLQSEGKTVVLVGREGELEGLVAVADDIRPEAERAVARLQDLGVEVVMLTGDNERTARAIAERVGIDDFRAGLLPDEKVAAVEELMDTYDGVAMVGDGINDAPALATATVGVAMGAAGTDTAIETADVALMGDDLSRLPYLYELADAANGVIRQNIYASLGAKALLAVGVPLGYVSVAVAVLVGDAGMTVGVTSNAMRLSRITPEE